MSQVSFIFGDQVCQVARADGSPALVCAHLYRRHSANFHGRRLARPDEEGLWLFCSVCCREHCWTWQQSALSMVSFLGQSATLQLVRQAASPRKERAQE